MPTKQGNSIDSIAEHVEILNKEVGKLKTSMKWVTRIIGYMAILLTVIAGKSLFF